ncbi:hypothetical protein [Pseudochryseolinea flava]|uniref:Uncharacterized protein n=1 Tax=Pseudochryseolinea flava TaxID=2059302 RepID=A0A364XTY5_9BACT|nr:hypothetical protein [Pseudochryseolinea flava]RAV97796.1 hypothetical protein DQQ10_26860 [Pseudochryseolinea flava]
MQHFKSKYYQRDFSGTRKIRRLLTVLYIVIAIFVCVALYHHDREQDPTAISILKIFYGMRSMSIAALTITGGVGLLIGSTVVLIINRIYNYRSIIIAFEFNDEDRQVRLTTKNLFDQVEEHEFPYGSVRLMNTRVSDSLNIPSNAKIFFDDEFNEVGYYIENH